MTMERAGVCVCVCVCGSGGGEEEVEGVGCDIEYFDSQGQVQGWVWVMGWATTPALVQLSGILNNKPAQSDIICYFYLQNEHCPYQVINNKAVLTLPKGLIPGSEGPNPIQH